MFILTNNTISPDERCLHCGSIKIKGKEHKCTHSAWTTSEEPIAYINESYR